MHSGRDEVVFSEFDEWAEPLRDNLARIEENEKFRSLDDATRELVREAIRESSPDPTWVGLGHPGEAGAMKVIVRERTTEGDEEEEKPSPCRRVRSSSGSARRGLGRCPASRRVISTVRPSRCRTHKAVRRLAHDHWSSRRPRRARFDRRRAGGAALVTVPVLSLEIDQPGAPSTPAATISAH
jgi:hypothetical protein